MKAKNHSLAIQLFTVLLFCFCSGSIRGATINDVFNEMATKSVQNTINNRTDNIRDRVIEIQLDSRVVQPAVVNIQTRVQNLETQLSDFKTDATETFQNVASGAAALAGDTLDFVNEQISDIQQKVANELDGRDDFVNNQAPQFRTELVTFLTSIESIVNTLSEMTGTNIPFDLTREKALLNGAPDRALFPLYKVMTVAIDFQTVAGDLSEMATTLADVRVILEEDGINPEGEGGGAVPSACDLVTDNPRLVKYWAFRLRNKAWALQLMAKIVEGLGETSVDVDAGIHGYAHVTFQSKTAKTVGKILGKAADLAGKAADALSDKIASCEFEARHQALVDGLELAEAELAALNSLVASRASQASLDALSSSLVGLDPAALDAEVSSRATQASVDELSTKVMDGDNMDLRIEVELQLSDPTRQLSAFFLPEAHGGKLEFVREVVAGAIAQNEAAGLYSGTLAGEELLNGDAAAATNDFRGAYDKYRKAYQEAVKWPVSASIGDGSSAGSVSLNWSSDRGGIYLVQTSLDLEHWIDAFSKVVGEEGTTQVTHNPAGSIGFYRVYRLSHYDPAVTGS